MAVLTVRYRSSLKKTMTTWQHVQIHLGGLAVDGIPGPLTAAAVAEALGLPQTESGHRWRAIQEALGIHVDGIPGPQTLRHVIAALKDAAPEKSSAGPREQTPYDLARTYLGTREIPGKRHNSLIVGWLQRLASWVRDDETPWCSAFVDHCARETGHEATGKLNARSWLKVGSVIPLKDARRGDVIIFWRVRRNGWQGHVAFLHSYDKHRNLIYVLGGNQRDEVNIAPYRANRFLGARRLRKLDQLQGSTSRPL